MPTNGTCYDIGSFDINGSHKDTITNHGLCYLGVDLESGKNVDLVIDKEWNPIADNSIGLLVSGSCLEHVEAPWKFVETMYKKMAKDSIGIVTLPFMKKQHKYPIDCYRILPDGLKYLFGKHVQFDIIECDFTVECIDTYIVVKK